MPVAILRWDAANSVWSHAGGGAPIAPPDPNPLMLPQLDPSQLLASGNWVTFESLMQAGDTVTVTTDSQGGTFRAFDPGVFTTVADRVPAGKGIVFGTGTYEINTPGWTHGDNAAWQVPKQCIGMAGQTPPGDSWNTIKPTTQRTTLRIKPNTGPNVNWLGGAIKFGYSGSLRLDIANIHFEGTDQGLQTPAGMSTNPGPGNDGTSPRLFNLIMGYNQADGNTMRDCLSTGWSGNNGAPPGETFGVAWDGSTGGKLHRVCVDGRRAAGGPIYGSAGMTFGSSTLDCEARSCYSHHNQQAGFVMFQAARCTTYDLVLGDPADTTTVHATMGNRKGDSFNHERTTACVNYRTTFNSVYIGTTGVHLTHSNDSWTLSRSGQNIPIDNGWVGIVDPVSWTNLGFSGAFMIQTWQASDTGGSYGNGNTMRSSNLPRFVIDDGRTPQPATPKWSFDTSWLDVPILTALP